MTGQEKLPDGLAKKEIWKPKSRAEMQEQIRSMMQEG